MSLSPALSNDNTNKPPYDAKLLDMSTPTEEDLLKAVKETLQKDGRLGRFKAELRGAVMAILQRPPTGNGAPDLPEETKLVNDLLREYLTWNGYIYTEQLLVAESAQSKELSSRESMALKLGVLDDSRTSKIPLLYYLVSAFVDRKET